MNYKTLNLIKNILTFPFRVVFRTIKFILTPVMFMVGFCMTDWKDEFDRKLALISDEELIEEFRKLGVEIELIKTQP